MNDLQSNEYVLRSSTKSREESNRVTFLARNFPRNIWIDPYPTSATVQAARPASGGTLSSDTPNCNRSIKEAEWQISHNGTWVGDSMHEIDEDDDENDDSAIKLNTSKLACIYSKQWVRLLIPR